MRKKITMLLASLFACVGVMKAQVPTASTAPVDGEWSADTKWYTITGDGGKYVSVNYADTDGNLMLNNSTAPGAAGLWCVVGNDADGYKFYNYVSGTSKVLGATGSEDAGRMTMYDANSTVNGVTYSFDLATLEGQTGYAFVKNHGSANDWWNQRNSYLAYWNSNYAYSSGCTGSQYVFAEITDFSTFINIAALKEAAKAELDNLANITVLFGDATQAKADVDAVNAASNSLGDLNAAAEEIQAVVANYKKQADDKNVRFTSYGRNTTDGTDLTAVVDGANQTSLSGDAGIWTLKFNEDGTFKMYNFVSNLYLGATAGNGSRVSTCSTFADAAPYTFNAISENRTNIQNNANTLHADGWGNVVQWNSDNTTSESSIWTVVSCDPIVLTREQYDNAAAAASSLPYAIQQAYGLVTDAAKYTSNAMQTNPAEGSYANLLDNDYSSYFHTSWSAVIGADHYLQAEVSEEVKDFYFYFKKRDGNNNNRPTEIEVLGSSDGEEFTAITTITEGLPTDAGTIDYISAPITAESNVKYIRFVVKSTNTGALDNQYSEEDPKPEGHPFFTFSEFYIFPATNDVTALIGSYNAFSSLSITEEGIVNAATSLINAESTLALANIKKEINALLTANASNHAETPALGQYTTEAYNALNTAYNAADATQESLEEAIATFEAAKNVPVYFITSKHDDYAAGSAIYYDGANWKWKTANIYDRQMWMTIPSYANADVPVVNTYDANGTHYAICDYLTGSVMRGKSVQIVKIEDWDDAYNLQYGTTVNDAVQHAQAAAWGSNIVGWNAATTEGNKASAWGVEFIGGSYDLKKLTDNHLTALVGLQAAHDAKAYAADAEVGEGFGQYQGDKDAIVTALNAGKAILDMSLAEQAALEVEAINAAAEALKNASDLTLNMPVQGKFYRIKSVNSGNYVTAPANTGVQMTLNAEASANNILYWDAEGHLLVYGTGYYINGKNHAVYGNKDTYTVEGSKTGVAGAYAIKPGSANYWHDNGANLDVYQNGTHANCNWTIEEVTELPVAVSAAGYATLYAPVALTIPAEGVTVYTATVEDGYLALTEVEGAIPANTGVIIEAAVGTYNFAVAAEADAVKSDLVGSYAKSVKNADAKVYTLQKPTDDKEVGFYLFKGQNGEGATTYINGFRAWVEVANGEAAPAMFSLGRGEGTTSIDNVQLTNDNVVIYDLAGRRVEKMEKGIYIVNGKKVVK